MKLWPIALAGAAVVTVAAIAVRGRKGSSAPEIFENLSPPQHDVDAPRGERQRVDAPVSRRDAVAGEIVLSPSALEANRQREAARAHTLASAPLPELLDAAFEAGADTIFISRNGRSYSAAISASKMEGDGDRSVSTHASAWGKARTPESAVRDALGKLDRDARPVTATTRRKAIKGSG